MVPDAGALGDGRAVPPAAVLVFEQHQLPVGGVGELDVQRVVVEQIAQLVGLLGSGLIFSVIVLFVAAGALKRP